MEEVVKKLGPDALIVSTSKKGSKVEIEATDTVPQKHLGNQRVEGGNFSDILHSKIGVLREKQRDRIYNRSSNFASRANWIQKEQWTPLAIDILMGKGGY